MSVFDSLHPALQHHIVNSLGWQSLRPVQELAIEATLAGHNTIVLAPTAGGKTEAAFFADDVVLLRAGEIVQRGAARDLAETPAEDFVADFVKAQRSSMEAWR